MKPLNKHIAEYYQGNKFLGSITHDGEVPQEQVGYYGQRKMTEGEVRLKRVHKASEANPLTVAAHQLGRKSYGIEIEPRYCAVIIDRMKKLDQTLEVKKNGKPYKTGG
jgi:hypothetical protein